MNCFVSFELLDEQYKVTNVGQVVISNTTTGSLMADLEAIKNDSGVPGCRIRVLCLTVLP